MTHKVELVERAKEDIRSIYRYIAEQLSEPLIAEKQFARIKGALMGLSEMPKRFPLVSDEPWRGRGLRRLVVGNYLAFYIVENDAKVVVMRVMYGGRDIDAQLSNPDDGN
jgi:toxin ParE1/3/4